MKLNTIVFLALSLLVVTSCNLIKGKKGGKSLQPDGLTMIQKRRI